VDDVDAIVGDASELATDRIVTAVASGDGPRAIHEFVRALSAGESAQAIIAATERYFHRLHRVRTLIDRERSIDDALRQLRPPLHFKQKDAFTAQCRAWTTARLVIALSRIKTAARAARLAGPLEEAHAEQLLIELAGLSRPASTSPAVQRRG
jgi:DNA polymerase-3 subunit delta